jgi:hypothetical protein
LKREVEGVLASVEGLRRLDIIGNDVKTARGIGPSKCQLMGLGRIFDRLDVSVSCDRKVTANTDW